MNFGVLKRSFHFRRRYQSTIANHLLAGWALAQVRPGAAGQLPKRKAGDGSFIGQKSRLLLVRFENRG